MFNDLPLEILVKIFISLHQQNKVEYMAVCRHWKDVIQTHCLFDTLRIDNLTQLDMIITKLDEEPSRKNQVKELLLDLKLGDGFDAGGFINQFSGLQAIYMTNAKDTQFQTMTGTSFQANRVKFLYEQQSNSMIPSLLKSTTFPQLTRIRFNGENINEDIVSLLANAPSLEQLEIPEIEMTLEKFETMHKSLPFLKSFNTNLMTLDENPLPSNISPANTMTAFFAVNYYNDGNSLTKLFQYFCLKYPNLEKFELVSERWGDGTIENVQQFCQLGLYPFLRKVAYKLKDYSINIDIDESPDTLPDYFGVLEKAGSKIKSFSFESFLSAEKLAQLMQSTLIKHVVKLDFRGVGFKDFKLLAEFPVLKAIRILNSRCNDTSRWSEFRLGDFLGLCNITLDTIFISGYVVQFDWDDIRQYSIEALYLEHCKLPEGLDYFISRSLPHLHSLRLTRVIFSERKLYMPNINFTIFGIFDCKVHDVLVHTINDNQQRWWKTKVNNIGNSIERYTCYEANWIPATTAKPFSRLDRMPSVTLVCASLKNIDIRGQPSR